MVTDNGRFIASGDLRLWTERFGDPRDPAVLLIMGTSAQGIGWPDEMVNALVEGGHQVVRFDHRDTGRSDCVDFATHPYTLADMAADSVAVLDGHEIAVAHIVGASVSGTIGQLLAVHHPERRADPHRDHDLADGQQRRPRLGARDGRAGRRS